MKPKLSIITINHNHAEGLKRTIQSVASQLYRGFEYIVVDGNSTDGSIDIIQQNRSVINTRIIEPDRGIYHAMNKGIQTASGEYLLFLNSGDELTGPSVLQEAIGKAGNEDLISFDLILADASGERLKTYPENPTFLYMLEESLPHPATFIKSDLFKITNGYDERFKICGDWAFFTLMLCLHNVSYKHIGIPLSKFHLDGISSLPSNRELIQQERALLINENFPRFADLIREWNENRQFRFIVENSRLVRLAQKFGFAKPR